ncbi:MAG: cysteine--tRNA ligase [Chloroflexota bacterium]
MKLHDTMTGELMELEPVVPGKIGIYVCGVTPYDSAHVGHAMSLIVYDVLVRYLRWRGNPAGGYEVTFVSNYTDVDDKLIDRGAALGIDPLVLANQNIEEWEAQQQVLGLMEPQPGVQIVRPRVSTHIEEIKAIIGEIIANDFAYVTPSGDVYFHVRKKANYGKLSHRNIEDLLTGTRFEPGEEKQDPLDFALWKAAKPGEPSWDSPWGKGRPGWHIECSAMAQRHLYGEGRKQFDLHGGGLDLIFPHHENEIAQSEAAAGSDHNVFARLWMHNGMVQRDGEKMSKSIGNVVTVQDALDRWSPDAIRLYVLSSQYRSRNNLTDEAMAAATAGVERLRRAATREVSDSTLPIRAIPGENMRESDFVDAMEHDLDSPRALSVLFNLAAAINRSIDANQNADDVLAMQATLGELAGVLGLTLSDGATGEHEDASRIEALLLERTAARGAKNFARADEIRAELDSMGIVIEDTPQGARWSVRR